MPSEVRSLLHQARFAIYSEPAAITGPLVSADDTVGDIRAAISVTVGHVVVRLNQAGFGESDRLYKIRDELAAGRPIAPAELIWLNGALDDERPG
jgi:hypothetical protein